MQELEALSRIGVSDELLVGVVVEFFLLHDEVVLGVQRKVSGFGFGIAVEADEGAVAGVDVSVGAVEFDASLHGAARITQLRYLLVFPRRCHTRRWCRQRPISQHVGKSSFGLAGRALGVDGSGLTIAHNLHCALHLFTLIFTLQGHRSPKLAVSSFLVTGSRWLTFLLRRNSVYAPTHIC